MKKIKWGIISTGKIANAFAQDFEFVEKGELMAVASRRESSAREFAQKYAIPKHYGSYEALFADPDLDAVYIATPHNFHKELSMQAIEAGKAVLCEKPITINENQAQTLFTYAAEKKVYIMEAMWTYFLPAIQKVQAWVNEGRIGVLKQIKADFGYPVPFDASSRMYSPALAGGALLDMGIYPIAMAQLFISDMPASIQVMSRKASSGVDNDVSMLFDYGDKMANLATSFSSKLFNHLFVIGTEGTIQVPDFWKAENCFLYKADELIDNYEDGRKSLGFHYETDAVNQDLLDGKLQSDVVPHATSLQFQKQMDAVRAYFE